MFGAENASIGGCVDTWQKGLNTFRRRVDAWREGENTFQGCVDTSEKGDIGLKRHSDMRTQTVFGFKEPA
jgi:hypothetical protein